MLLKQIKTYQSYFLIGEYPKIADEWIFCFVSYL